MTIERDAKGNVSFGRLEFAIKALIAVNMVAFAFETTPGLSPAWHRLLLWIEYVSVFCFSVEYLFRLALTRPPHRYAFSFFGIVDLLAVLPFYLGLAFDLRTMRALRLLRLFRMLKLARYGAATHRLMRAFVLAKEEIVLFGATGLIILYLAAVGIHYFEDKVQPEKFGSMLDCLWWAVVTMTTVGYGDAYPVTPGGKLFTSIVLFLGLGFIAVPTGLLVSALSKVREEEDAARNRPDFSD